MKYALLVCFLGTSLAVSPFEAIVEEWEVGLEIYISTDLSELYILDMEVATRKSVREELRRRPGWLQVSYIFYLSYFYSCFVLVATARMRASG